MTLNDLLTGRGIHQKEVLVLRHRPVEPQLRKVLPWLAAERPEVFNPYQRKHGERVEGEMVSAKYVASFIGHEAGRALFVGLYTVGKSRPLSPEQRLKIPDYRAPRTFGLTEGEHPRRSALWFDLTLTDFYAHWKGKSIVGWPSLNVYGGGEQIATSFGSKQFSRKAP